MIILKILGAIDLLASLTFLALIFSIPISFQILLFLGGLLFVKGMFVFTGDPLSIQDFFYASCLILSIFFALPASFLWISAFLLLSKGVVSFL